ncbi:hypothetical protein [Hansschlegelia plantiphila]|uniref:Glycoside hydrolase family 1 protein n=1 Tax=Hansschlegelia plantiphila TaxID=374655 RepID=A0A9W6J1J8_9HYPH|nr:hypothetical protein [Hansschlegelia plantiphila]GLK67669.1 hypothetical protein GCM10008179_13070 [Hansschlegelia plantiphila]
MARRFAVGLAALCLLGALRPASALAQQTWLSDWAAQKSIEIRASDAAASPADANYDEPVPLAIGGAMVRRLTAAEQARSDRTVAAYRAAIGANAPSTLLWTGIETGNPLTRNEGYRWNSLRDQGLFDPEQRAKVVSELQALGLTNVRIGLSNHEIDLEDASTWKEHDALVADFAAAGLNLSLDLHHFGVEDRFRSVADDGTTLNEASYYLHPEWPDYFARFAAEAFARYGDKIRAVTLINEPETTVGFNSEMWNGAFPGWGDPRHGFYYVERAFAIATAAVKARVAIEAEMRKTGRRVLFMHTEGAVFKPGRPEFNRFTRFLPSDLILGQDWLMTSDLKPLTDQPLATLARLDRLKTAAARTSLDWLIRHYVLWPHDQEEREANRTRLVALVSGLRALHQALARDFHVTMGTDTLFAADYYAHNEDRGASGSWLDPQPQLYAAQMAAGERRGLYPLLVDYYNRYRLPMMIGETGTPFYAYGARWHAQMLLECAQAMADGVPMLGYTIYPLIDTFGWETALSAPKSETSENTGGILTIGLEARPFMRTLLQSLNNQIAETARVQDAGATVQ